MPGYTFGELALLRELDGTAALRKAKAAASRVRSALVTEKGGLCGAGRNSS